MNRQYFSFTHDRKEYLDGLRLDHDFTLNLLWLHLGFGFNRRTIIFSVTWW